MKLDKQEYFNACESEVQKKFGENSVMLNAMSKMYKIIIEKTITIELLLRLIQIG